VLSSAKDIIDGYAKVIMHSYRYY